jgi:hypothetical protein
MSQGYAVKAAAVAVAAGLLALSAAPCAQAAEADGASDAAPSPTAARLVAWIVETGDNSGLPFVVVDKSAAVVSVYAADGAELGSTPALIGQAIGDDSVPGIGERPMSQILPEERTTPAGRFVAAYGPAYGGTRTLWVDYATAISLHPVATSNRKERRTQRLKSPSPDDNRITYGCINVAAAFYKAVVHQTFAETKGVVYVLPDTRPLAEVFPSFGVRVLAEAGTGEGGR